MRKLVISREQLQWPNRCAACGGRATGTASSTCAVVTDVGYYVVFLRTTHRYTTVTYPVCTRHNLFARIAGFVAARNLINLGIGVLWAFVAFAALFRLAMLVDGNTEELDALFIYTALMLLGVGLFEFGRRFTPIKLENATEDTITLLIRSDAYADAFAQANSPLVKSRTP